MLSRVYPIHANYKKHAVELIGTFSYGPNRSYLKGTSQVWEYYKTSTGAGARRSVSKKNINYKFYITSQGYCNKVTDLTFPSDGPEEWQEPEVLSIGLNYVEQYQIMVSTRDTSGGYLSTGLDFKFPEFDQFGNIVSFDVTQSLSTNSYFKVGYDYNIPRGSKNYSFIPSQNLISQEYSLLEVMQWVPQPTHQRTTVAGVFRLPNNTWLKQRQYYHNYQFDAKGNQISVTYGDNIPQRTTWFCK